MNDKQFMNTEVPTELALRVRMASALLNISRSEFVRIASEALLDYLDNGGVIKGDLPRRLKSGKYQPKDNGAP